MSALSTIDILILLIVGISCLIGLFRGLIKEALSLLFWVGAIVAATFFSVQLGAMLSDFIVSPLLQRVVGFILIFVVVVFVGGLISNGVSSLMSQAGLGAADRALGALFGILRGGVIVTVIVMLTGRFNFTQQYYAQSVCIPYVMVGAGYLQDLLGVEPPSQETISV
ncbi:MAG: CvpA family protein [Pseudomonadota bacterium]